MSKPSRGLEKRPWVADVDVYLTKDGPNPNFYLKTSLPKDPGNDQHIIFHNDHRPGFHINFNLYDESGGNRGYVFPPQDMIDAACWSQKGAACPTAEVWDVFHPEVIKNGGLTLLVYNENPSPKIGDFKYVLRVTNDGGASFCELDPGGTDSNGARK